MGWWSQDNEGHSFADAMAGETVVGVWGDEPADILDNALDAISEVFMGTWGRLPSRAEMESGIKFSMATRNFPYEPGAGKPVQQVEGMLNVVPGEDPDNDEEDA